MFFISFHFTSGSHVVEVQSGYNIILQRRFGEVKKHGAFMRTGKPAAHCTLTSNITVQVLFGVVYRKCV